MALAIYQNGKQVATLNLGDLNDLDSADSLRLNAFNKQSAFNPHIIEALSEDINDYKLIYRSGVEVELLP